MGFGLTGLEALSAGIPILVSLKLGFGEAFMKVPFSLHFVINSDDHETITITTLNITIPMMFGAKPPRYMYENFITLL